MSQIMNFYSIYDKVAGYYAPPFLAHTHGAAIRMVSDACRDRNSRLAAHPADFSLACIGAFSDSDGRLVALASPDHVCNVSELVAVGDYLGTTGPQSDQPVSIEKNAAIPSDASVITNAAPVPSTKKEVENE